MARVLLEVAGVLVKVALGQSQVEHIPRRGWYKVLEGQYKGVK